MNWPKYADNADYANYAEFAEYAEHAEHAEYAEDAEYAEYLPVVFFVERPKTWDLWIRIKYQLADLSRPFGLVLLAKQKFDFVFFGCGYCWELHFLVHIWLGTGAVLILVDKRGTALDWQATNLTDAVEQFWVQTWKFNHVNILNFNQLLSSMVYILETLQILCHLAWLAWDQESTHVM